ncbi:hypothetical protein BU23DRAFT_423721, partial [Bimuria novae-zelandiae CBS 107.79]
PSPAPPSSETEPSSPLMEPETAQQPTVQDTRANKPLWYKLNLFIYHLLTFRSHPDVRARLDSIIAPDYIGLPYFPDEEAALLRSVPVELSSPETNSVTRETLQDSLDWLFKGESMEKREGRMRENGEHQVCTAHDLEPVFVEVFGVVGRGLRKDKTFLKAVKWG